MTIYQAIESDHESHRNLLERISDTSGDSKERQRLWEEFYYDVKAHAAAEEEVFYAKLIATEDGQPDARHSVHEHQNLDSIMDELHDKDMSSPGWIQRFGTLKHDYEHHMEEEEDDIFARAREEIGQDSSGDLGRSFQTRKKREFELVDRKNEQALED
ncbi:MAG: hemerythrin domain-containing protein [Kiloniellales bacterium]